MTVPGEQAAPPRTDKALIGATDRFAEENRAVSWWCVGSTVSFLAAALLVAALAPWWPLRAVASLLGGLLAVRTFVIYHDFMHGAILRGSRLAKAIFYPLGILMLTPPRSWRKSHNFHHGHVGQIEGSSTGSFEILTTEMWRKASPLQRLSYRIVRHPLTIACAYLTVFVHSICLLSLLENPRRHWDSAVALAVHALIIAALWIFAGPAVLLFAFLGPIVFGCAVGAYLFYAQHNYDGVQILPSDEWDYYRASLESSSYLKLGPVLSWFTANIGYHHVHHLNPLIPFYRLPEAMAAIPELQRPVVITLHPRDVVSCLRLKLWDPKREVMVRYRDVKKLAETDA